MVPDQAIGASGRTVRCAKCHHTWFVAATAESSLPGLDALMEEEAARPKPKPIPPGSNLPALKAPSASLGLKLTAGGLFATACALLALALWPQVYGLPRSEGLALAELNMLQRYDEARPDAQHPLYEITGKIVNTAGETLDVPTLRVTVTDKEGNKLQYWDFSEDGKTLEAGGNIPFSTGPLEIQFNQPSHFIVELGSGMELALRRTPDAIAAR